MLLHNPFFWLGQIGLILTILSAAVLVYRLRHKTLLITLPIWGLVILALIVLVHPIRYAPPHAIWYMFELLIGLIMSAGAWVFSWTGPRPGTAHEQKITRGIVRWGGIAGGVTLSYIFWKLKQIGR